MLKFLRKQKKPKTVKLKARNILELNKTVTLISEKFSDNKRKKVEREKIMKRMQKEIRVCRPSHGRLQSLVKQGQYFTRNCFLIPRLGENRNEINDKIVIEM